MAVIRLFLWKVVRLTWWLSPAYFCLCCPCEAISATISLLPNIIPIYLVYIFRINLTFWDEMAHIASEHVEKGQQIYVSGRLVSDTVKNEDESQQTYYKVSGLSNLSFLEISGNYFLTSYWYNLLLFLAGSSSATKFCRKGPLPSFTVQWWLQFPDTRQLLSPTVLSSHILVSFASMYLKNFCVTLHLQVESKTIMLQILQVPQKNYGKLSLLIR